VIRFLLTAFFFEAGLVLVILPWTVYWEENYFVQVLPLLEALLVNNFVRGAVSGLGLLNLAAGFAEIWSFLAARQVSEHVASIRQPAPEE